MEEHGPLDEVRAALETAEAEVVAYLQAAADQGVRERIRELEADPSLPLSSIDASVRVTSVTLRVDR